MDNQNNKSWKARFKHLVMTGETMANEERKAELKPRMDMADKTYKVILFLVVFIFFVVMTLKYFL